MRHKVEICIGKEPVLGSRIMRLPQRLLNFIFGDVAEVILLKPGSSVERVEVHEVCGSSKGV